MTSTTEQADVLRSLHKDDAVAAQQHGSERNSMDAGYEVGSRISQARKLRGATLREIAAAAGVSPSFLSQLERGLTNASVASLRKIASALGVPVADLLESNPRHTHGVLRASQRPSTPLSSGSEKFVIAQPPVQHVEIYVGRFESGGATGQDPYVHGKSQEFLIVLSGKILLELGDHKYVMDAHDSIEYLSSVPHRVENIGSSIAEVMWVTSPPTTSSTPVPSSGKSNSTQSETAHPHELANAQ
ncbi:XRE family transcriptional regulator [Leucobacter sp. UT-8R-CII-1-4]|uniref:helix-turn-helix domain-containing protein n=1 Tax=Leucobacter sp. UT-8R-CII-1-4 TaxID=3040075 RepID=UPI0024A811F1|nr:XRE family transcriptional regulator [Leucobacter sp. UT-8R-CII-1-4]MDI6024020.1 XRE family transcriptional regulator [Leucobacter sp. UT-8R-CII-1-4]